MTGSGITRLFVVGDRRIALRQSALRASLHGMGGTGRESPRVAPSFRGDAKRRCFGSMSGHAKAHSRSAHRILPTKHPREITPGLETRVYRRSEAAEAIVDTGAGDILAQTVIERDAGETDAAAETVVGLIAQVDIEIFRFDAPRTGECPLDAATDGPAGARCVARIRLDVGGAYRVGVLHVRHRQTASDIDQGAVKGGTKTPTHRSEPLALDGRHHRIHERRC